MFLFSIKKTYFSLWSYIVINNMGKYPSMKVNKYWDKNKKNCILTNLNDANYSKFFTTHMHTHVSSDVRTHI